MDFILQRINDNRKSTIGVLLKKIASGKDTITALQGFTLEDEYREDKVSGETRIPAGFYKLGIRKEETPLTLKYRKRYAWFKNHIEILNVPNFKGVYIHIGNTDVDTDGCVLLGDAVDNNSIGGGTITNSTVCFQRFYSIVFDHLNGGGVATLEIRDEKFLIGK